VSDSQRTPVDEHRQTGGRSRAGEARTITRWTFDYRPLRRFVECRLPDGGRVLNVCAGKSKLNHDGEVVRIDADPERDADHHIRAGDLPGPVDGRFDAIVFDPPFDTDECDAEAPYATSIRADELVAALDAFRSLAAPGAVVIALGWNSWGMRSAPEFERDETTLFCRGPCLRDLIVAVDRRMSAAIGGTDGGDGA